MKHDPNMRVRPAGSRGMMAARAESVNMEEVNRVLSSIQSDVKTFRDKMDEREKNVAAKFDDVVTRAELDKVNSSIEKQLEVLDGVNARLEALRAGAGGSDAGGREVSAEEAEYNKKFAAYMVSGDGEGEIKAANRQGGIMAEYTVGNNANGGYTAPIEWDRQVTDKLKTVTPMRRHARVQRVGGAGFTHLFNLRGTASGWVGETDARPATDGSTFAPYTFSFGEIYAMPSASEQILEDSEINFAAWLSDEVDTEFAAQEGTAFLSGDGSKKPKGVLMYDATAEAALAAADRHPLGPVLETNSGDINLLTPDGLIDLVYNQPEERISDNSKFFMNRKTHGIVRKFKDGNGNYLWQPPVAAGEPATLLGYGLAAMSGMPDVAANAIPVMFGDMDRGYRIFDRVGVSVLRDPYTAKPYVLFYTRKRVGGGLWNPEWLRYHRIAA